ncbi:mitochondrial fission process protein 1 [Battus philenor]|uniref:mitochondrial fission process protein 1 n=1 Tax=Battus philenor TaxID=42288 RepID=UPI0035CEA3F7
MPNCEVDLYRDTWVRYMGYANEVGESFRPLVPGRVVQASYALATAYVLADTADKSWKMYKKDGRPKKVLVETGDALIWQTLASVVIPGFTVNRICKYSQNYFQKNYKRIPVTLRNLMTVGVGLASIPFIVHPIDNGVSLLMDLTYRKWIKGC